jgi:hypothetical protein
VSGLAVWVLVFVLSGEPELGVGPFVSQAACETRAAQFVADWAFGPAVRLECLQKQPDPAYPEWAV